MLLFNNCPVCMGHIVEKELTEVISDGKNKATLKLRAYVCSRCSERFYSLNTVRHIEKIKAELKRNG